MIVDPPSEDGAVKATLSCPSPGVIVPMVGAAGAEALEVEVTATLSIWNLSRLPVPVAVVPA